MTTRPLRSIIPGDRVREDMGDIGALAESIKTLGLIQPIVIDARYNLLAGARRLEACKRLGMDEIEVVVMLTNDDVLKALAVEEQENTCRKDFTPTEAAKLRKRRADLLAAMAKERQREHGGTAPGRKNTSTKLEEVMPRAERETRRVASRGLGYSPSTLDKVDAVLEVIEDETQPAPVREVAKRAVTEMNATGKVDGAHKKVERAKVEHSPTMKALDALLDQPEMHVLTMRLNVTKGMLRVRERLLIWPPEAVANALTEEHMSDLSHLIDDVNAWFKKIEAARPRGLRLVGRS
jgi:ParB family transcriptional regulator, chromosome partitioning protein